MDLSSCRWNLLNFSFSLIYIQTSQEASKKIKLDDTDDFPFTETTSGMASPAHSDASHESNKFVGEPVGGHDESSNEALIVDCDSPSDHDTPGKQNVLLFKCCRLSVKLNSKIIANLI